MKNKPKWHSILLIGLILLLAVSVVGCSQAYTEEDIEEAYQTGYNAGFTEGYNAGLAQYEQIDDEGEVIPPPDGEDGENKELPAGAINWDEAKNYIGERMTVCGPVVDAYWASGSSGKPTFINIGKAYPSLQRFTVVIWIGNRGNFTQPPEDYFLGRTICITGLITEYEGIAQIEATSPNQIEEP